MKDEFKVSLPSLMHTQKLAKKLSGEVKKKIFISLRGDLGTGKTTFARYFINSLSHKKIKVLSPTFSLVQFYELSSRNVWHFDLYRLRNPNEIFALDFDLALNDIVIMEWPEKIQKILPCDRIEFFFKENECYKRFVNVKFFGKKKLKFLNDEV